MNIFFTADEHHGHESARAGWGDPAKARPFASLDDMTEGLIGRHNAVFHLGDMFWRTLDPARAHRILSRLNGAHYYVWGNHEEVMRSSPYLRALFTGICERRELRLRSDLPALRADEFRPMAAELLVVLDHYAGRVWNGAHRGSWQLHGHSHGSLPDLGLLQMDVGVDCNGFAPVSLERVAEYMRGRTR
jgi:calcineurin-like phosphoesterase family protein